MPAVKGISTYQTYLMYRTSTAGTFTKLIDITSFPDLVPPKDRIDITSLSDYMRVYINGIGDTSEFSFGANYTVENYTAINTLEKSDNIYEYAVWFGASGDAGSEIPDGHNGKFTWSGEISAGISGGGVNEAVGMTINCTPSTVVVFSST